MPHRVRQRFVVGKIREAKTGDKVIEGPRIRDPTATKQDSAVGGELLHERRQLLVEILLRHRSFSDQYQREYRIAVVLLAGNSLRLKPHDAEPSRGAAGCVTVSTAITLPLLLAPTPIPAPMSALPSSSLPASVVGISVIDGEKGAKGFLTEMARIIKASVAV